MTSYVTRVLPARQSGGGGVGECPAFVVGEPNIAKESNPVAFIIWKRELQQVHPFLPLYHAGNHKGCLLEFPLTYTFRECCSPSNLAFQKYSQIKTLKRTQMAELTEIHQVQKACEFLVSPLQSASVEAKERTATEGG